MKELTNTNEIFDYIKEMVSNDNFGNKMAIARMYGAFQREEEVNNSKESIIESLGLKNIDDIIIFSDDILIVKYFSKFDDDYRYNVVVKGEKIYQTYKSYEESVISVIAFKNGKHEYLPAIMNLLGL